MQYTIDTLDECNGSLELSLSYASWDAGNGPIAESVADSLELTLLDPARTGCECHPTRLGLYQRLSDDSLWLAEAAPSVDRDAITLRRVTASQYLAEISGPSSVEAACLAALTD